MPPRPRKLGLAWTIFLSFAVVLVAVLAVLYALIPQQADAYLTNTLVHRGKVAAREIAWKVPIYARDHDEAATQEISELSRTEPEVLFAAAMVCASSTCQVRDVFARTRGVAADTLPAVLSEFNSRNHPLRIDAVDIKFLAEQRRVTLVADAVSPKQGTGTGFVVVALDRRGIDDALYTMRLTLLLALGIGSVLSLVLVSIISRVYVLRPLRAMLGTASRLSQADLTGQVREANTKELGMLADALDGISRSLRETLGRVRGVSEGVAQVIDQISRSVSTLAGGATTVQTRVEETSSSMVEMMASLRGIAENVEVLYQSAEESSSSIMEMAATNDEVAEQVSTMAASVQETTAAIEQMTGSVKEVAKNVAELYASAEETSSSMNEMDVSIGQVETNANETARLSEQVSQDAELGMTSVGKTIAGIDKIKEMSRQASFVIESLGKRIQEIGNIVNVIDDVAEQTNLLALNAAIIAAQAGEHGKGFAVVADEIKDLAERTGTSTKEISEVIRAVQEEARHAVVAMTQGMRTIDEGVQLGRDAEGALSKIAESANKSTMMIKAIARATVEQSRGSKQVTASIQRIAETVQEIRKATNEQARGSEQIMKSSEQMKTITAHVQRSSQEQAHGSKQITRSIENINEMVTHLNRAQKEQTKGTEQVLKAVEQIKTVSEHQAKSARQLEEAVEQLRQQADVLRAEVRRFRV